MADVLCVDCGKPAWNCPCVTPSRELDAAQTIVSNMARAVLHATTMFPIIPHVEIVKAVEAMVAEGDPDEPEVYEDVVKALLARLSPDGTAEGLVDPRGVKDLPMCNVTCHPGGEPCSCSKAGYAICGTTLNKRYNKLFKVGRPF